MINCTHAHAQAKDKKELQHVRDEKNLMFAMQSRFLVGCVDYFMDAQNLYFLLELCNAGMTLRPRTRINLLLD